jgi:hypothetical protein
MVANGAVAGDQFRISDPRVVSMRGGCGRGWHPAIRQAHKYRPGLDWNEWTVSPAIVSLDFGALQLCVTGSGIESNDPSCLLAELDEDGDVDAEDIAIFHSCMTGSGVPLDPACNE